MNEARGWALQSFRRVAKGRESRLHRLLFLFQDSHSTANETLYLLDERGNLGYSYSSGWWTGIEGQLTTDTLVSKFPDVSHRKGNIISIRSFALRSSFILHRALIGSLDHSARSRAEIRVLDNRSEIRIWRVNYFFWTINSRSPLRYIIDNRHCLGWDQSLTSLLQSAWTVRLLIKLAIPRDIIVPLITQIRSSRCESTQSWPHTKGIKYWPRYICNPLKTRNSSKTATPI